MPAGSKISIASMNAEPIMPKISLTPFATIVSTKASLAVIFAILTSPININFLARQALKRIHNPNLQLLQDMLPCLYEHLNRL